MTAQPDQPPDLEIADGVATLRLRRPSKRHRLEVQDIPVLLAHFAAINADAGVRVAVLRSQGRVFSAGFDLGKLGADYDPSRTDPFEELTEAMEALRPPTLAAVCGAIYGGAVDLALACDFRIGIAGMKVLVPAANLGLNYYGGGLRRAVARLGLNAANRIYLCAETLNDTELLALGYLNRLCPADAFEAAVATCIENLAGKAPLAVEGMKAVLNAAARGAYDAETARTFHSRGMRSDDLAEGLSAFAEKRVPVFAGR